MRISCSFVRPRVANETVRRSPMPERRGCVGQPQAQQDSEAMIPRIWLRIVSEPSTRYHIES